MSNQSYNLKIHFYGVQGSGSVFTSQAERLEQQVVMDQKLLEQVFIDLSNQTAPDEKLNCTIEELLGGDINRQTLRSYRQQFDVEAATIVMARAKERVLLRPAELEPRDQVQDAVATTHRCASRKVSIETSRNSGRPWSWLPVECSSNRRRA